MLSFSNTGGWALAETSEELLARLPATFRYSQALDHISERQRRRLLAEGSIIALARGVYRKSEWIGDEDLNEIAAKSGRATLCLRSALAHHHLIDDIPAKIDIAIPRGSWAPKTVAPVKWRHFDSDTFNVGRQTLALDGGQCIGIYSGERSIIDAFRMRHIHGTDLAIDALKRWLRENGQPSELLALAAPFPRARTVLRETLEILL